MQVTSADDGKPIPEVGLWAKRKYHYLGRYLDAFTTAMREKWSEIHYVDLFAGAGLARIKDTDEVVETSALLAAGVRFPFTGLHLCDTNAANVEALKSRLSVRYPAQRARVIHGDANQEIAEVLRPIPRKRALCVTFADPFGLHLDFETVRRIAEVRSDLIVLLADNMDAVRNWARYYFDNPDSNLDRFMGEAGWRDVLQRTPSDRQAMALRDRYLERLKSECGYLLFDQERVQNSSGRDIYLLVFATRDPAGLKIWKGVSAIDEGGQRKLFG